MSARTTDEYPPMGDVSPQLSVRDLKNERFKPRLNNSKKTKLRPQMSKPPPNAVKIKPEPIDVHFTWALVLTILCFFLIAPCWALVRTSRLRRMIKRGELEDAKRLSHRISTVLMYSTIVGIFLWVAILFCSAGLMLTGKLLDSKAI